MEIIAKELGTDLSYILRDTIQTEDYQLTTLKSLIERFVRITSIDEYFNKSDNVVFNPDEFIFSLLQHAENSLILQMDENLLNFARNIAEAEDLKKNLSQQEYENRILVALRKLHKSKPRGKVKSYCLASIQDIEKVISEAVKREVRGLCAIEEFPDSETV